MQSVFLISAQQQARVADRIKNRRQRLDSDSRAEVAVGNITSHEGAKDLKNRSRLARQSG
jgi:hypothetical protein